MKSKQDEVKSEVYLTTDLLKSKALSMYQQDFAKVILEIYKASGIIPKEADEKN